MKEPNKEDAFYDVFESFFYFIYGMLNEILYLSVCILVAYFFFYLTFVDYEKSFLSIIRGIPVDLSHENPPI